MTNPPLAIIFDLDGTLIDSAPTCAAILTEMLGERGSGRIVEADDARDLLTRGGADLVGPLLRSPPGNLARDLADFRARYAARRTPVDCLYPGVADGLRTLALAGARMAVCSNKPQSLCDKIIADLSLDQHLPVVIGSVDGIPLKPAPDLALKALERLGSEHGACWYVGDSGVDSRTAANAGIPFLLANWGYAEPGTTITALARFDDFDAVVRHVARPVGRVPHRRRVAC